MRRIAPYAFMFVFALLIASIIGNTSATTDSIWNSTASITEKRNFTTAGIPIEATKTTPCRQYIHTNASNNAVNYCVFSTGKYTITDDAKIIVFGMSELIPLENKANTSGLLIPLPSSTSMLEIRGSGANSKVVVINNAYSGMQAINLQNGKLKMQITSASQEVVQDNLNNSPLISQDYRNISSNGNWLISQNGNGIYKINLQTKELQYIREAVVRKNGLSPLLGLSISNDGRYAAVYSGRENRFEIIDTFNCQNGGAKLGKDAKCSFNDYASLIKSKVNNIYAGGEYRNINFVGNSSVKFFAYTNWVNASDYNLTEVLLSANTTAVSSLDYLALGDSYASGEGVFNYKSITNEDINKCHLSELSYPYSFMNKGIVGTGESVACSGARVKDIINVNGKNYDRDNPQSSFYARPNDDELKDTVLDNYIPGGARQLEFIELNKPNIITLSVGGNDIGFSKIITSCVAGVPECYETRQERQRLVSIIENAYRNLVRTYTEVKDVNPNARIYIIGYPQVAKVDGNCAVNVGLTNNEIAFTRDLISYLNSVIRMAANEAGVYYTNTEYAFEGRRLCEIESNLSAMNGLTAGPDSGVPEFISETLGINGPLGQESYHPNVIGHNMFSKKIIEETDSFKKLMPNSMPGNPLADSTEKSTFLNAVEIGDEYGLNAYNDESITQDAFTKDGKVQIVVDGEIYFIKPNSQVSVYAYSTPTLVGTTTTDANGNIIGEFSLPNSIEPGYHTIHVIGKNIANQDVDIQKIVYVAASMTDYDGDGILNEDEACLIGVASGLDVDVDGIDDACDGFIDVAPDVPVEELPTPTPPVEVVDDQPEVTNTSKELPVSESRPEWLLIKEREIAEEQAAANQSATITPPDQNTVQQNAPITTYPQQTTEEEATIDNQESNTQSTTQVAGVSSAVESRQLPAKTHNYWWLYAIVISIVALFGFGVYKYVTEENRV